nr:unnamed protein product [Digitaria exilis]
MPLTLRLRAVPLALLLLAAAAAVGVSARAAGEERQEEEGGVDPEVAACRQQCARQRQFDEAERRHCLWQCDEYGRAKRRHEEEEREEGPEREREIERCLHECRVGPPKPGCERRCREAYERATRRPRWQGYTGHRGAKLALTTRSRSVLFASHPGPCVAKNE